MRWPTIPPIVLLFACLLMLIGCTQEQTDRAAAAVVTAQEYLDRVEAAEDIAKAARDVAAKAVETARALAIQLDNEKAASIVAKAEHALRLTDEGLAKVSDSVETGRVMLNTAEVASKAAQAAQAAGGSTIDVLIAILGTFIPAAGVAAAAIRKAMSNGHALKQTVQGVALARTALGEPIWKEKVAPALNATQDEAVRNKVSKTLAAGKAA